MILLMLLYYFNSYISPECMIFILKLNIKIIFLYLYIFYAFEPNFVIYFLQVISKCGRWFLTIIAHLWCKNIEVSCSICPADQLAHIFGRHTRIFGHPHHRRGEPVSVQTKPIVSFTLLLTIALA